MTDNIEMREFEEENEGPFNSEWVRELGSAVKDYLADDDSMATMRVINVIMAGLIDDETVPVPATFETDDGSDFGIATVSTGDCRFLLAQPVKHPDYELYAAMKLSRLMLRAYKSEDVDGIIFGSEISAGFILPKPLIVTMLALYCTDPDEPEQEDEEAETEKAEEKIPEGTAFSFTAVRPMSEEQYESVADAILGLKDRACEHVLVEFRNTLDDELLFMQAYAKGEKMHVELGIDMSDCDWEHPLILANDEMDKKEAAEFFGAICAGGLQLDDDVDTDSFRDITGEVFGE